MIKLFKALDFSKHISHITTLWSYDITLSHPIKQISKIAVSNKIEIDFKLSDSKLSQKAIILKG